MFMEYLNALRNKDLELSEFYFERFRLDFKPAVEALLETKPFENPDAPLYPMLCQSRRKHFLKKQNNLKYKWQNKQTLILTIMY